MSLRRIDHSSRGVLPTVARRFVWTRNLENEEAKARYRAVENTTTMGCNAGKQTNNSSRTGCLIIYRYEKCFISAYLGVRLTNHSHLLCRSINLPQSIIRVGVYVDTWFKVGNVWYMDVSAIRMHLGWGYCVSCLKWSLLSLQTILVLSEYL
jgi:hypothetical protein